MLKSVLGYAFVLSFVLGLVFWARQPDPYTRDELIFANSGKDSPPPAILMRPRLNMSWPVLVFANEKQGDPLDDGNSLKQMTAAGFISVDAHFNQWSFQSFAKQFNSLLKTLGERNLPGGRGCAWVANGIDAELFIQFAAQNPEKRPDVLVCAWKGNTAVLPGEAARDIGFPIVILREDNQSDSLQLKDFVNWLREGKNRVEVYSYKNSKNASNTFLYKEMAEKVRQILHDAGKAQAPGPLLRQPLRPGWTFFGPAAGLFLLFVALSVWMNVRNLERMRQTQMLAPYVALVFGIALGGAMAAWVVTKGGRESWISDSESKTISSSVEKWGLIDAEKKEIREYLALADYNRRLVNWNLNETDYQDYVLSPVLKAGMQPELNWRWQLWHYFYPKIRRAGSPFEAAALLAENLRGEVEIQAQSHNDFGFARIWNSRVASPPGFEFLYVAALRSVGIGARLNTQGAAEILDNGKWQPAPPPPNLIPQ